MSVLSRRAPAPSIDLLVRASSQLTHRDEWRWAESQRSLRRGRGGRCPERPRGRQEGIPLTSDHRPFTILPSDFADAMRQPPGAPRKATRKIEPAEPTTLIPELNAIEFTPFAYQSVIEAIDAFRQRADPEAEPQRRAEISGTGSSSPRRFSAHVMDHAYNASVATNSNANDLVHFALAAPQPGYVVTADTWRSRPIEVVALLCLAA